jgi:hypothetical protein
MTYYSNDVVQFSQAAKPSITAPVGAKRRFDKAKVPLKYASELTPATLVSIGLLLCFIAIRFWRLTAASLDGDEIFSLILARQNLHDLMISAVYDATHPPLFYLLLKVWIRIGGDSLFWLRLFPFTACTLCLFPFFALCRTLNIRPLARNLALAIAAVHPYAIFYAQHVRMYSLLMVGGLLSANCFAGYLRQPSRRRLVILAVVNLGTVYVHYFGWMIVGLELLFLILNRLPWRTFAVASVAIAALFSPWGIVAGKLLYAGAMHEKLSWISRPSIADFFWFYVDLAGCTVLPRFQMVVAAVILSALAVMLCVYWRQQSVGILWLMSLALAPPLITVAASPWLPLWGERHLVFTVWPFLIVLADCISRLPKTALAGALVVVAAWIPFAVQAHHNDNRKLAWVELTMALMDQEHSSQPHIPVYSLDRDTHYSLEFYVESLKIGQLGPLRKQMGRRTDFPELAAKAARFEVVKATSLDMVQGPYFWLMYSDPFWKEGVTPEEVVKSRNCRRGEAISVRDVFHSVTLVPVQCPGP